jgi:hypothetical protein
MSNIVLSHMSKCAKKLVVNLDKTNIIQFMTNNSPQYTSSIGYDGKYIEESVNTKFLDLQIDNQTRPSAVASGARAPDPTLQRKI